MFWKKLALACVVFLSLLASKNMVVAQVEIPETGPGKCLSQLLDAINSEDKASTTAFLKNSFVENDEDDVKRRATQNKMIRSRLGELTLKKIAKSSEDQISVVCNSTSGTMLTLTLNTTESSPAKIESVRIEMGDTSASNTDSSLDETTRKEIVESLASELRSKYVFPDIGEKMATAIESSLSEDEYADIDDTGKFATVLTKQLRKICNDKHLGVRAGVPKPINQSPGRRPEDNHGFVKAEMLPGGIGYLKFDYFAGDREALPTASAAMNFLSNSKTLIFDLRENGGGSPGMISYLTSYLYDEPTHLNSFYNRPTDTTSESWTLPDVPGKRFSPDTQVFVVTSNYTFSGAEEFAYNLKNLKRATIVGETTGGGAHPVMPVTLAGRMNASMPFARAINPITNTNWEGVGVKPHVETAAGEALEKAIALAREHQTKLATTNTDKVESTQTSNVDVSKLARRASELMSNESFEEAAKAFSKVVSIAPDRGNAWFGYGYSLHMSGQIDKAIEAHKKAATFDQFKGIATYNLACAYSLKDMKDKAIAALEQAVELGFGDVDQLEGDSDLDNIRQEKQYKTLLESLK